MKPKAIAVYLAVAAAALATASSALGAQTTTIGSTAPPNDATLKRCGGHLAWQFASASATPFVVPAGGTQIVAWETHMSEANEEGANVTLVVLRPAGDGEYEVVATNPETLPEAVPADETASFAPVSPIAVEPGDMLGVYSESDYVVCAYWSGEAPSDDTTMWKAFASAPLSGEAVYPENTYGPEVVNVAATVELAPIDLGVSTSVAPANAIAGQAVALSSLVANHSTEAEGAVTVTDAVPAGLTISAAAVGNGVCRIEGQSVICTVAPLAASESVPLIVAAQVGAAGTYVNKVSVLGSRADANPANDHAEAALTVLSGAGTQVPVPVPAPAKSACEVPRLRTVALAAAKRVLRALRCKPGNVRKAHSRKVAKGDVVSTAPGPGSYALGRSVTIVVSSGRAHAHRHSTGAKHSSRGAKHKGTRGGAKGKRHHLTHASAASRIDQRMLT